jgi:stearoyl-CoA desaturase (delta-9 desaturase)
MSTPLPTVSTNTREAMEHVVGRDLFDAGREQFLVCARRRGLRLGPARAFVHDADLRPFPAAPPAMSTADRRPTESAPIVWSTSLMFALTLAGALTVVPWYGVTVGYSGAAWACFIALLVVTGLSITAGYHRLWAHRAYSAHAVARLFFLVFGTMAIQNSVLVWASGHRSHHRYVDDVERDPYSARRGLWFSHIGWMLRDYPSGRPDFSNVPDLKRDPMVMFQHRHYLALILLTNISVPLLLGVLVGDVWGVLLLGGLLRLVINHHVTFFINSLAHYWGAQPYTDENTARDNPVLAFLTYGEGYHNFHHLYASDYRNGVRWWQWDPTKWLIRALSFVGLSRNLRRIPDFTIQRARLAMQFRRLERRLAARRAGAHVLLDVDALRAQLAREYEVFAATVDAWVRARDEWYARARDRLAQRFEFREFRRQSREYLLSLRAQHRRLQMLGAQLA